MVLNCGVGEDRLEVWGAQISALMEYLFPHTFPDGDTGTPEYAVYYALRKHSKKQYGQDFTYKPGRGVEWWARRGGKGGPRGTLPPPDPVHRLWRSGVLRLYRVLDKVIRRVQRNEYERPFWKHHPATIAKKALDAGCEKIMLVCVMRPGPTGGVDAVY